MGGDYKAPTLEETVEAAKSGLDVEPAIMKVRAGIDGERFWLDLKKRVPLGKKITLGEGEWWMLTVNNGVGGTGHWIPNFVAPPWCDSEEDYERYCRRFCEVVGWEPDDILEVADVDFLRGLVEKLWKRNPARSRDADHLQSEVAYQLQSALWYYGEGDFSKAIGEAFMAGVNYRGLLGYDQRERNLKAVKMSGGPGRDQAGRKLREWYQGFVWDLARKRGKFPTKEIIDGRLRGLQLETEDERFELDDGNWIDIRSSKLHHSADKHGVSFKVLFQEEAKAVRERWSIQKKKLPPRK